MLKARFKTAAEFERSYGPRWRDIVNFSESMDKFLGQPLPETFSSRIDKMYAYGESFYVQPYTITSKMIIFDNDPMYNGSSNWVDRPTSNLPTKEKSDKIDISYFKTKFVTV